MIRISLASLMLAVLLSGCAPAATPDHEGIEPEVLVGAGDISLPGQPGDDLTADVLEQVVAQYPNAVIFADGDITQGAGTADEYQDHFALSWGRFIERIRPVPGNHDYLIDQGAPYYDYFGAAAGRRGEGYYSYDLGEWHIVALNSNCNVVDCAPHSAQAEWLRADLQNSRKRGQKCTLLYWHHPHWSVDVNVGESSPLVFWQLAQAFDAEIVLNGHDHIFERYDPQDVHYNARRNGVRLFLVGTGGAGHDAPGEPRPNSVIVDDFSYGVLQFKLYGDSYEWQFIPVAGSKFTDTGSGTCH